MVVSFTASLAAVDLADTVRVAEPIPPGLSLRVVVLNWEALKSVLLLSDVLLRLKTTGVQPAPVSVFLTVMV